MKAYSIRTSWFTLGITFNPIARLWFWARGQNKFSESLDLLYGGLWIGNEEMKKLSRWHCSHSHCSQLTFQPYLILLCGWSLLQNYFCWSHNFSTEQAGFYSDLDKHSLCCTCWVSVSIPAPLCWGTDTPSHLENPWAQPSHKGSAWFSPPTL